MKEREDQMQVEAAALDRAVEAMARELYDRKRVMAALGGQTDLAAWDLLDDDLTRNHFLNTARAALQAADDHLREHYWAEFRERLEGEDCIDAVARDVWQKRNQHPWEKVPEKFKAMLRDNTRRHLSVLATTQHKGAPQ